MGHQIFNVLDEFGLLRHQKRFQILSKLTDKDISQLIDKLESAIETKVENTNKEFCINLPYSSLEHFKEIPSYLFLCDKIYILDPLVDYLEAIPPTDTLFAIRDKIEIDPQFFSSNDAGTLRLKWIERIDLLIDHYVNYKELIEEHALVPFIDSTVRYESETINDIIFRVLPFVTRTAQQSRKDWDSQVKTSSPSQFRGEDFYTKISLEIMHKYWNDYVNVGRFIPTTLGLKQLFPSTNLGNLAIGSDENRMYLDDVIKIIGESLEEEIQISWPTPEDEVLFSTIGNIPSQELLAIRHKERDALQKFRYYAQEKLIGIRSAVGTKDYKDLIAKFSIGQRKQIAEMSLLANHIQKDHLRKSSFQLTTTFLSAAGAILTAITSIQDPLALVGTGIASAGFTAGISKLVETWISYKGEMDKLREKDSYILWKLHKNK